MAVLRASQLWLYYVPPAATTKPINPTLEEPPSRAPGRAASGYEVFICPSGYKAIVRCVTGVVSGGNVTGLTAYWGFAVFKQGGTKLWMHWESFDNVVNENTVQAEYARIWRGMLVLNGGDKLWVYGANFVGSLDTSGSGMLLPIQS